MSTSNGHARPSVRRSVAAATRVSEEEEEEEAKEDSLFPREVEGKERKDWISHATSQSKITIPSLGHIEIRISIKSYLRLGYPCDKSVDKNTRVALLDPLAR